MTKKKIKHVFLIYIYIYIYIYTILFIGTFYLSYKAIKKVGVVHELKPMN